MIPDVEVIAEFVRLMQSPVSHFLMTNEVADDATVWLLSQGIEHDFNDLYLLGRRSTAGTVISIVDPKGALAFRLWATEVVRGPLSFSPVSHRCGL